MSFFEEVSEFLRYGFDKLPTDRPAVVAVGSFDGVHSGHRVLLERLKAMAKRIGGVSVVVSFDPHPRIAMGRDEGLQLLTSVEERAYLLREAGIDYMVVAHFDEEFRRQPYAEFVGDMLYRRLGMRGMIVGYNHRLGRDSEGNFDALVPLAERLGFEIERVEQHTDLGDKISSTVVRNLLSNAENERATKLLGHPYIIIGNASEGRLWIEDRYKLLPMNGRYSACVNGERATIEVVEREIVIDPAQSGRVVIEL